MIIVIIIIKVSNFGTFSTSTRLGDHTNVEDACGLHIATSQFWTEFGLFTRPVQMEKPKLLLDKKPMLL